MNLYNQLITKPVLLFLAVTEGWSLEAGEKAKQYSLHSVSKLPEIK